MTVIELDGRDMLVRPTTYPSKEVKDVLGGRWDRDNKGWRLPPTSLNVAQLVEWYGADVLDGAPDEITGLYDLEWGFEGFDEEQAFDASQHPRWDMLYPFQRDAVEYATCNVHAGALVGLSPGLGKTPVSTVTADLLNARRILVCAPLSLTLNWEREMRFWSNVERQYKRATAGDKDPGPEVTITNFETLNEVVHRDEHGKVVEALKLHVENEDEGKWVVWDVVTDAPEERRVGPAHFKAWREQGPKKENDKGKMVPARERVTQARRAYSEVDWDLVIIDESILFKNRKAVKVDVVQQICKFAHHVILLSGSPTAKFRDDLYPQLKTIMPRAFASYWRFAEQFCVVERGQWGWNIAGDLPGVDLHEKLKDFVFIRDQKDVLPDLPDYIERPLHLELTQKQRKAHDEMLEEWLTDLEGEAATAEALVHGYTGPIDSEVEAPNRLAQITRLQQITSNLCNLKGKDEKRWPSMSVKEDALVDLIRQDEIETPLLVWVNFVPTGESYEARLRKEFPDLSVAFVHGGASSQKARDARDATLDEFKAGTLDVLILQFEVGKFGHTFTGTRTVYYADRTTNSDSIVQSLRRVKRIGLTHSPVLIVPRCPGTIDEFIEQLLEGKLTSIAGVSRADLIELLRSLGAPA